MAAESSRTAQAVKLITGPIAFALVLIVPVEGLLYEARVVLATLMWSAAWWLLRPIPWVITSLLLLVLLPLFGVMNIASASRLYGQNIFFWLLGLAMLARALTKHGLGDRMALRLMSVKGVARTTTGLVFSFMLTTSLLSMFASDAAVVAMMIPIAISVYSYVRKISGNKDLGDRSALASFLALAVIYGAEAGGVTTIVGLPANAVVVALTENLTTRTISWFQWMMVGLPLFTVHFLCFFALLRYFFPPEIDSLPGGEEFIAAELKKRGAMSRGEINVLVVFFIMVTLFTAPALLSLSLGLNHPTSVWLRQAVPIWLVPPLTMILLFIIPVNFGKGEGTLVWEDLKLHTPWNSIFLITAAVGMAAALREFGLLELVRNSLEGYSTGSFGLPLLAALVTVAGTNFVSGTASAALFGSLFIPMAEQVGFNPASMAMLIANVSVGVLFPWSGAVTATAFASGFVEMRALIKVGIVGTVLIIFVTVGVHLLFAPIL